MSESLSVQIKDALVLLIQNWNNTFNFSMNRADFQDIEYVFQKITRSTMHIQILYFFF